jgi:thiol-disulfide isomerase/thioredoxin
MDCRRRPAGRFIPHQKDHPMRLLCAAALSLTLGLCLAFSGADRPASAADSKADRAAKLADLKKKYDATFKELLDRFQKADPKDKAGIRAEIREETLLMAEKVVAVAEGDPKDEVAFDAASFVIEKAGPVGAGGPSVEKAVGVIADNHAASPKVKDLLVPAMRMGKAGEKLLKAVSEKAADKETKATALFIRGYSMAQSLDDEEDDKKLAEQVKQATALLEQAAKLAPDAKIGQTETIGKLAAGEIENLKGVVALGVGKPAPAVASKTLDDKPVKLADYKGKVVLLDIWATWCGPCRAMIPHESDMVEKMKGKPFVLVSVSADDKKETLQKFLEKEKMPWVHWWNDGPETEVLKKFRVRAFPTLYLIDHSGVIRHKWVGNPGNEKIDAAVEELVKAATKAKG